jgi:hypothetical protein
MSLTICALSSWISEMKSSSFSSSWPSSSFWISPIAQLAGSNAVLFHAHLDHLAQQLACLEQQQQALALSEPWRDAALICLGALVFLRPFLAFHRRLFQHFLHFALQMVLFSLLNLKRHFFFFDFSFFFFFFFFLRCDHDAYLGELWLFNFAIVVSTSNNIINVVVVVVGRNFLVFAHDF